MELITTSRLAAFRACKRLHFYQYELCRRPRRSPSAAAFGTLFHAGQEHYWLAWMEGRSPEECLELALAAISAKFFAVAEDVDLDPFDLAKCEELMRGYHFRWAEEMSNSEVLGVESEFRTPLVNPETGRASRTFEVGGKIDGILRKDGIAYIVEHKTTTKDISFGSSYWRKLKMDPQVSNYLRGAKSLGHDVEGCIYDVARRPLLRPFLATPVENRKYTKGKPCLKCGGTKGGKGFPNEPGRGCDECGGGWIEAPRLSANQRDRDETVEEFRVRVREDIAADPNGYYQRGEVVMLEDELSEHDRDTWLTAKALKDAKNANAHPRNPSACEHWGRLCDYWSVCSSEGGDIDNDEEFVSTAAHVELTVAAQTETERG